MLENATHFAHFVGHSLQICFSGSCLIDFSQTAGCLFIFPENRFCLPAREAEKGEENIFSANICCNNGVFCTGAGLLFYDVKVGRETVLKAKPKTQEAYSFKKISKSTDPVLHLHSRPLKCKLTPPKTLS
jgi:hypothetical protein